MKKQYASWKTYLRCICLILFAALFVSAYSQQDQNDMAYLFRKDWSAANSTKEATYFMKPIHENDSTYICRYYNKFGSMVLQESFLDSMLTIPNGRFCWYDQNGMLDSTGLVYMTHKTGVWNYYNDAGEPVLSMVYDDGRLVEKRDYLRKEVADGKGNNIEHTTEETTNHALVSDSLTKNLPVNNASFALPDSGEQWKDYLKENIAVPERFIGIYQNGSCTAVISFTINKQGRIEDIYFTHSCEWSADNEVFNAVKKSPPLRFTEKNGDVTEYNMQQAVTFNSCISRVGDSSRKSSIYIGTQEQAKFPGGPEAWQRFLQQHLNLYVPKNHGAQAGEYLVIASFLVGRDGTVTEVKAETDPGYGAAEEVIRVLKKSPKWIPAMQDGKPVKYRQKQAFTFHIW